MAPGHLCMEISPRDPVPTSQSLVSRQVGRDPWAELGAAGGGERAVAPIIAIYGLIHAASAVTVGISGKAHPGVQPRGPALQ